MSVPPSNNLYIAGLPSGLQDSDVKQLFEAYGTVTSVKVLQARQPGAPVHALVRFSSPQEAEWVVANLDGNIPQGLTDVINAKFANAPGQGGQGAMGGQGKGCGCGSTPYGQNGAWKGGGKGWNNGLNSGCGEAWDPQVAQEPRFDLMMQCFISGNALPSPPQVYELYVANLPPDTTDRDMIEMFSPFGAIPPRGCKAMANPDGTCKGIGFVNFTDEAAAQTAALTLNGAVLPWGKQFIVKPKDKSGQKGDAGGKGTGGKGTPANYKTTLCNLFAQGNCPRKQCNFAHGEADLRPYGSSAPDSNFDAATFAAASSLYAQAGLN